MQEAHSPSPLGEQGVSPFAYWLGLTLKYFLKTSRKCSPSQKPVLSATFGNRTFFLLSVIWDACSNGYFRTKSAGAWAVSAFGAFVVETGATYMCQERT